MKSTYKINLIFAALFLCVLVLAFSAFNTEETNVVKQQVNADQNHKNTAYELVMSRKSSAVFESISIFKKSNRDNSETVNSSVSEASFFALDRTALRNLYNRNSQNIILNIPSANGNVELELSRVNFIPDDFKIVTSDGRTEQYSRGLYFQGIIKNDKNSMAAISIFENEVIGIVSTNEGNYNLGALLNDNNEYIYYNDRNLLKKFDFKCDVEDGYGKHYRDNGNIKKDGQPTSSFTVNPVRMYYVCDYQMYLDKGSNTQNVVNYVTAVFNQENLLYNNETLNLALSSSMFVYTSADPYRSYSTSQTAEILYAFGTATKNNFDGNLAQLLSTRTPVMGAIAWVNVLCQSYEPGSQSGRYAFIELENTYNNVPIYSWSVEVMAHETGHNFGSSHTQACIWPSLPGGGIGAIDSCVAAEQGSCFTQTRPNPNGTIMSYCHIPVGGAINFTLGFGPLPGDTIRLRYSQALCIDNPI
ncbi:MAG TPA: M12 family metallo-peptidase, partial [Ignavibacteria bacterium]|nr:M12 family metallo-peptidase [Ignavibacteria bacterium]